MALVTSPHLFVDLDGTLIKNDLLVESYIELGPALLPYHPAMLGYLRIQREAGREVHLATVSNHRYASAIAGYLGVFDGVLASNGPA